MEISRSTVRSGLITFNICLFLTACIFIVFTTHLKTYLVVVFCVLFGLNVLLGGFLAWKGARRATLASSAIWLLLTFAASEVSLRHREGIWTGFRFDSQLGWYPIANQKNVSLESKDGTYRVTTDRLGHRNDLDYPADHRLSVVLQGDSNAFGFGLAQGETFCALFTEASGTPCFNLGVAGYDAQHYYFQFENIVRRYAVGDRIILFNVGNDFTMSALESPYLIRRPYLYRSGEKTEAVTDLPMPFKKQVYGHRFIAPYGMFDEGMQSVSTGRDWGRTAPEWLADLYLPTFIFELFYPRIIKLYNATFKSEEMAAGRRLNPYYPDWLLLRPEHWPQPYRRFRADFSAARRP